MACDKCENFWPCSDPLCPSRCLCTRVSRDGIGWRLGPRLQGSGNARPAGRASQQSTFGGSVPPCIMSKCTTVCTTRAWGFSPRCSPSLSTLPSSTMALPKRVGLQVLPSEDREADARFTNQAAAYRSEGPCMYVHRCCGTLHMHQHYSHKGTIRPKGLFETLTRRCPWGRGMCSQIFQGNLSDL